MSPRLTFCTAVASMLFVGACSSTRNVITAYTDPDFVASSYRHLVVDAAVSDLQIRQLLESALVEELRDEGVDAEEGARIFTPTREWTAEGRAAAMRARGADGVLRLTQVSTWTSEHHTPATTTTNVTIEKKEKKDGDEESEKAKETVSTTTTGGYTTKYEWARYEVKLVDVATDRVAWVGVMELDMGGHMIGKFKSRIIEQLQVDRKIAASD